MKEEDITNVIKHVEDALNQNREGDMESYLEGRLSAFEDILDIVKKEKKNKKEEDKQMWAVYSKLAAGWLELGQLIASYEGTDITPLKEATRKIQRGLELIIFVLPEEE